MGEIFLARETGGSYERLVILKSLLPDLSRDPSAVSQFLDEARVATQLDHGNIIRTYEAGEWQGTHFIAMEYIPGVSLDRLIVAAIRNHVPVPHELSARIACDVAAGLDYAHNATDTMGAPLELVHRDISPQNIMVRDDGVTKILDFGIARTANRLSRTRTGMVKGKVGYMSPEQLQRQSVDAASDQYSLGIVLWEMCAHERWYGGDGGLEELQRLVREPVTPLGQVAPEVPEELERIVSRMTALQPRDRYPSCGAVGSALGKWLAILDAKSDRVTLGRFVEEQAGDESQRHLAESPPQSDRFLLSLFAPTNGASASAPASAPASASASANVAAEDPAESTRRPATGEGGRPLSGSPPAKPIEIERATSISAELLPSLPLSPQPIADSISLELDERPRSQPLDEIYPPTRKTLETHSESSGSRAWIWRGAAVVAVLIVAWAAWQISRSNATVDVGALVAPGSASLSLTTINSKPSGAQVWLGKQRLGQTPLITDKLAPGTHRLTFKRRGFRTTRARVHVAPNRNNAVSVDLRPEH